MSAVRAADVHVGDVLNINDWHMPVDAVDVQGRNVAVHVAGAGYDYLLHYGAEDVLDVDPPGGAA